MIVRMVVLPCEVESPVKKGAVVQEGVEGGWMETVGRISAWHRQNWLKQSESHFPAPPNLSLCLRRQSNGFLDDNRHLTNVAIGQQLFKALSVQIKS